MRKGLGALLAAALATAFVAPGTHASADAPVPVPTAPGTEPVIADDRLLVKFEAGTRNRVDHIEDAGADFERTITADGWLAVDTHGDLEHVRRALEADPAVADVEFNYLRTATAIATGPLFHLQDDYLDPLRVQQAWEITTGAGKTIAVVDTGVDLDHEDLIGRFVSGFDFVNNDATPQDDNGHGTLVAGAAAASANAVGVIGVAPSANVMPIKVLNHEGSGSDVNIALGIRWAAENGADIINLSLAGPGNSAVLDSSIAYARGNDVVVVAATGNEGVSTPHFPAASTGVVAVGATGDDGTAAWFSNRGSYVDVAAPGIDIVSTTFDGGYGSASGTSLASPIVAGVAALVRADEPTLTESQVTARLRDTAKDRGPAGFDLVYGAGTPDAFSAVGGLPLPTAATQSPTGPGEPNGTFAQATPITTSAVAAIQPELDEDWYSFNAVPGTYTISAVPTVSPDPLQPRALNAAIELRSPANAVVAAANSRPVQQTETLVSDITTAGAYRIRVVNGASSASFGNYTL
ncbi:MAG: S8 family serine peptidase, partial [Actinomycetota bacterium]|nr:S8 family serine peptidase [Actinomycetota bacterium]